MSSFVLFLILILDNIINTFSLIAMISLFLIFILIVFISICWTINAGGDGEIATETINKFKFYLKFSVFYVIAVSILSTIMPTSKQMMIVYFVPRIINNEQVQQIPQKILSYIDQKFEIDVKE
jgi:hypothetical protein